MVSVLCVIEMIGGNYCSGYFCVAVVCQYINHNEYTTLY